MITGYINNPSFYKRHKIKKYNLEMLHQTVCKDMFQTMGKSYEYKTSLWVGMEVDTEEQTEESWPGRVFQTESNGIKLEIISGEILEYDGYVFDMLQDDANSIVENIKEMYRPYLVEYYITQKEFGEKQRIFLEQMYQEKGWYRAALADEVTDKDTEKYVSFEGVFVHSASPVEYERKKLIILDTRLDNGVLNKIKNTYNMDEVHYTSDADIQKEWNKIFNGIRFQTAKIMQGDVPYMSLPTKVNFAVENPYEYLVVPHHGAEMDCSLLKSTVKKAGQAVICCTNELDKNRPKEEHLIELKRCYDDVKITEQARCYMQLDLQKKNQIKVY